MTRAEKVARAQELRGGGLRLREIAERMGVAVSTVDGYLNDPDGERLRARKDSYRGTCGICGRQTDGSNGAARAPRICAICIAEQPHSVEAALAQREHQQGRQHWSDEELLAALRRFALTGSGSRKRYDAFSASHPGLPCAATIFLRFGSWNEAKRRAGLSTTTPWRIYERISADECLDAIRVAASCLGELPSLRAYEAFRQARPELQLPSAGSVRNRFGGWAIALAEALPAVEAVAA